MSAAFDTVDIQKLLSILENKLNIKGNALKWFHSFYTGVVKHILIFVVPNNAKGRALNHESFMAQRVSRGVW